jgi:tryptophanyl-tRNA synthetase
MTQFKDKSAKHPENINAGLFTYPSLMAGDILLYQADYVPVGADQTQHLEFTRDIATRFNHVYGETFKLPEGYFPKLGARVMSLQEPTAKMSKSDTNPNATISILDEENVIIKKFKRAVTDSEMEVVFREGKDGINNLMTIYSAVTGKSLEDITGEFAGKGYGDFKAAVGEAVAEELRPVREKYAELMNDKAELERLMKQGAEIATKISSRTLTKARKKVGLYLTK